MFINKINNHFNLINISSVSTMDNQEIPFLSYLVNFLFPKVRVLVIGDHCLDDQQVIDPNLILTISKQTGILPESRVYDWQSGGGASNVCVNIAELINLRQKKQCKGNCYAAGIIGKDMYGRQLIFQLTQKGVDSTLLISSSQDRTPAYTKFYAQENSKLIEKRPRIDNVRIKPLSIELLNELLKNISLRLAQKPEINAVIINDQHDTPLNNRYFSEKMRQIIQKNPEIPFIVDSRNRQTLRFYASIKNIFLKPNLSQLALFYNGTQSFSSETQMQSALQKLFSQTQQTIFLTMGQKGILIYDGKDKLSIPSLPVQRNSDFCGAGDGVISILAIMKGIQSVAKNERLLIPKVSNLLIGQLMSVVSKRIGQQIGTGQCKPHQLIEGYKKAYSPH